jgi:hypothetical protein
MEAIRILLLTASLLVGILTPPGCEEDVKTPAPAQSTR